MSRRLAGSGGEALRYRGTLRNKRNMFWGSKSGTYMSASKEFAERTLSALLTECAERTKIEETISALIWSLADAHGIPASYPPPVE
jgi:hypothetical protein